jgi:hypothetical protein
MLPRPIEGSYRLLTLVREVDRLFHGRYFPRRERITHAAPHSLDRVRPRNAAQATRRNRRCVVNRLHALVVSLVLGAAGVVGAIAATQTMHLGAASAAPARIDRAAVRARAKRLNTWAKALDNTLAKRPPALPAVPQFGPVAVASYSTGVPVAAPTVAPTRRDTPTVKTKQRADRPVLTTRASRSASTAPRPKPKTDEPQAPEPTTPETTATTTTVPVAAAATAPAPSPVPTSPPPAHESGKGGGSPEPQDPPEPGDDR